ncbi:MAG: type IV toxin-antitoxin system AbiEi family antitoxin domain-containing protein [Thalassotalea sp.]|nr:type IV toxin-antitoxin system AbiEi family antitoxin domain-containing protein [Thalassotalea sp.]
MTVIELMNVLREADKNHQWAFTRTQLKELFQNEKHDNFTKSLARHVKSGVLDKVAHGIYVNPTAKSTPYNKLEALIPFLRVEQINVVTAETVLSRWSVISQMMFDYVVVMTTGSSKKFDTQYGVIEFIHTKQDIDQLKVNSFYNERCNLYTASVKQAYKDLKSLNRNLDLVDQGELAEAISEQNKKH